MSIHENRFRLFEAWPATKGYGWPLVGVFVVIMLFFVVVEIILIAVAGIGALSVIGNLDGPSITAFFERSDWMKDARGWLIAVGLVWTLLSVVSAPIMVAPWAESYRRIAGVKTEDAHAVFD